LWMGSSLVELCLILHWQLITLPNQMKVNWPSDDLTDAVTFWPLTGCLNVKTDLYLFEQMFMWYKLRQSDLWNHIFEMDFRTLSHPSLTINNIAKSDEGTYMCRATNCFGTASSEYSVLTCKGQFL
jgi:hypothetical protein